MEKHKKKGSVISSVCGALWMVAILAALYMIMEYPNNFFGLAGIGLVILGLGIIALSGMGRSDNDWDSGNSGQLQEMLNAQKALYVVSKQNEELLKQMLKLQQSQVREILEGNKNIAKVIVKKNMESTDKLIQSNASFMLNNTPIEVEEPAVINEQLTEKMIENLAEAWENALEKSNAKLVSQIEKAMDLSSIQQLGERMPEEMAQAMNFAMVPFAEGIEQMPEKLAQLLDKGGLIQELKATFGENQQNQQNLQQIDEPVSENTYEEIAKENEEIAGEDFSQEMAAVTLEENPETPEEPVIEETAEETPEEPVIEETAEETPEEVPEEIQIPSVSEDSNRMLSPDEIAALVAGASQSEPDKESVETVQSTTEMEAAADEPEPEEEQVEIHVSEDSNRQLSPEEIAALFASI